MIRYELLLRVAEHTDLQTSGMLTPLRTDLPLRRDSVVPCQAKLKSIVVVIVDLHPLLEKSTRSRVSGPTRSNTSSTVSPKRLCPRRSNCSMQPHQGVRPLYIRSRKPSRDTRALYNKDMGIAGQTELSFTFVRLRHQTDDTLCSVRTGSFA